MSEGQRDPLYQALLPGRATVEGSRAGSRQRAKREDAVARENEARGRAAGTLAALQDLGRDNLTERLLENHLYQEGGGTSSTSTAGGSSVTRDLIDIHRSRPLPGGPDCRDGALVRLVGESKVKQYFPWKLPRKGAKTGSSVPLRGEMWPARVVDVDLPPDGNIPVWIGKLSRRVRVTLERYEEVMLNPRVSQERRDHPITPYHDPEFQREGQALALACRMWRSGMLAETKEVEEEISLFTVVKKVEQPSGRIVLRLIVDARHGNQAWREPPWTPMAGPGALGGISFRKGVRKGGRFDAACGDLPDFFYTLELPADFVKYFVLKDVTTAEVRAALEREGYKGVLPDVLKGDRLGLRVVPMGWSWAVWIAQNCLLGVITSCLPEASHERVLVQGTRAPLVDLEEDMDWVAWAYVDDFGVLGLLPDGLPPEKGVVRVLYYRIRAKFVEMGFRVHKEEKGSTITALGLRIGHLDAALPGRISATAPPRSEKDEQGELPREERILLRPPDARLADMVYGTEELISMDSVPVAWVHSVLGIWTYYMLLRRAALSVFRSIYRYVEDYHPEQVIVTPLDVKLELAGARHLAKLLEMDLTLGISLEMILGDASPWGGAVGCGIGTEEEVEAEYRWMSKGGFYTVREADLVMANTLDDWVAAEDDSSALISTSADGLTVRILVLLWSDHRRLGFRWWLSEIAEKANILVHAEILDLCEDDPEDLADPLVAGRRKSEILLGRWDAVIGQLPGSTWSPAAWAGREGRGPRGPVPLRSTSEPWGISTLPIKEKKRVKRANQVLENFLLLMRQAKLAGVPFGFLHPRRVFMSAAATFWATETWQDFEVDTGVAVADLDLCMWESAARQPMRLVGSGWDVPSLRKCCTHEEGHRGRLGASTEGYLTQQSHDLPSLFCKELATKILQGALARPDAGECLPPMLDAVAGAGEAIPGLRLRAPPMDDIWDDIKRWRELYRWAWKQSGEPSNTLESRVVVSALRHIVRAQRGHARRVVVLTDNLCALAVFARGRSSKPPLAGLARGAAAIILAFRLAVAFRWTQSRRNHLDGPSRNHKLGYYDGG